MSCNISVQKGVKNAEDCKCYEAVMRTYDSLVEAGEPKVFAMEAAKIVYGYHHPEDLPKDQALTVELWINEESLH